MSGTELAPGGEAMMVDSAPGPRRESRCFRPAAGAVTVLKARYHPRMRVSCVPYAGAGASAFRAWPNTFPDDIELCSLQPAGRERRIAEPLAVSMPDIVTPLVSDIVDLLD